MYNVAESGKKWQKVAGTSHRIPMSDPTPSSPPIFDRMFLGEFARGIDKKGRVTLPATFREALGEEEAVITRGIRNYLMLLPKSQFDIFRTKIREMGFASIDARTFRRHFFSGAALVKPDSMGRINIPQVLREHAELTDEVIVAGADYYVEIWNAEHWKEEQRKLAENIDDFAMRWDSLGF
jgi:MraZ protein